MVFTVHTVEFNYNSIFVHNTFLFEQPKIWLAGSIPPSTVDAQSIACLCQNLSEEKLSPQKTQKAGIFILERSWAGE